MGLNDGAKTPSSKEPLPPRRPSNARFSRCRSASMLSVTASGIAAASSTTVAKRTVDVEEVYDDADGATNAPIGWSADDNTAAATAAEKMFILGCCQKKSMGDVE